MGYMTLADYRTDVQTTMGSRNLGTTVLDRYINFGYLDVAGSMTFNVLDSETSIPTVYGQPYVAVPANTFVVKHVRNATVNEPMAPVPFMDVHNRAVSPTGVPARWNVFGSKIYIRPVPDGVYSLTAFLRKSPTRLTGTTDASVLPDEFDTPILMLANSHGFLLQNEEDRAAYWLRLAINNLSVKIVQSDIDPNGDGIEALKARLAILEGRSA